MSLVNYIFFCMVVLMQLYFYKGIFFSVGQIRIKIFAKTMNAQSDLLHDLSRHTLFRSFSLGYLPLAEPILARPLILHQQKLLLVISGDDGSEDWYHTAIRVHERYGTGLDPDEVRKVFIKSFHKENLLLYAWPGGGLLRQLKFVEKIVIGSLEVIGQAVFSLLLVVEVKDEFGQQLLYDLFGQKTTNLWKS